MHNAIAIAGGLLMTALPFGAAGALDDAMAPRSTSAIVTVTRLPGAPATSDAQTADSLKVWVGGPDGTGLFVVGAQSPEGSTPIPVGRYEVKVAPDAHEGSWMLCGAPMCGPAFQENATVIGHVVPTSASTIYIGPKARTLWVDNVILIPVEPGNAG